MTTGYASKAHFGVYAPWEFGWPDPRQVDITAQLVGFSHSGVSFGLMHRDAVPVFKAVLDELVPLIPSKQLVAGQCGCFNPQSVTVGGSPSFHTIGCAIDVNWGSNPMYAPGRPTKPDSLPAVTSAIAKRYGCEWGGDWSYPQDWMHIEVHLPQDVARTVTAIVTPSVPAVHQEEGRMRFGKDQTGQLYAVTGADKIFPVSKTEAAILAAATGSPGAVTFTTNAGTFTAGGNLLKVKG